MTAKSSLPHIAICMGSQSDWSTMKAAADILDQLALAHEVKIISGASYTGTFIQICRNRP
jgi:phosphoribosylcarboxyaminoimidazole (NCAIR) mutase